MPLQTASGPRTKSADRFRLQHVATPCRGPCEVEQGEGRREPQHETQSGTIGGERRSHPRSVAVQFLRDAVAYYAALGVTIKRLLTDNGSSFRSHAFAQACQALGIRHKFTRAYRPQTNGKAERFIQSALREWAYGWSYQTSAQRTEALSSWQHHYNWHRPHAGIHGATPMSRLPMPKNKLLTDHN